ncbi:MAG: NAD(P)-dependent oxidoreductase [Planctomycetota bacterium]
MKILIVGAAGFVGRGILVSFTEHGHALRLLDVAPFASRHEVLIGDVTDYACVEKAVTGMDGIVIAHMAPRGIKDVNYATPEMAFNINVKGTANLFHAVVQQGVKKVVVISSGCVVQGNHNTSIYAQDLPLRAPGGYYGLSKICQEVIAEQFSREHDLQVACLRPWSVLDGEKNVDKYGQTIKARTAADTDRRDIGEVACLCLESETLRYEVFHVASTREALEKYNVKHTCQTLGWKPELSA